MQLQKNNIILRIKPLIILALCCFFIRPAYSQNNSLTDSETLEKLFGRLIIEREDSVRLIVNDSIKTIVDKVVEVDSIFNFNFNIRFLGQITSADSIIKIVSWNLNLRNEPSKYFCYLIKKNEQGKPNSIYKLAADYSLEDISRVSIYTAENWYGALYYEIRPSIINGEKYWIALGINFSNHLITKKIIDIIAFNSNDEIEFGAPVFSLPENELINREVFKYSADATMALRFLDNNTIVFDHLVPFSPDFVGKPEFYGPDFSYDAFIFENEIWNLKLDIDVRNEEY
jgi:hypothetical protein